MNIQYDVYRNTRKVLKAVRSEHKERLQNHLVSQGTVLSFILDHSLPIAGADSDGGTGGTCHGQISKFKFLENNGLF